MLKKNKFKFYTRKNVFGEYSLFTPDGNWIDDFESKERAYHLKKMLNAFLKRSGIK